MDQISRKEARKIITQSQLLAGPTTPRGAKASTEAVFNHLGYVQIDTISVIQRAHHHKLRSRVKSYKSSVLNALEREKKIFEYWSHAASYLPIKYYRYTLLPKEEFQKKSSIWRKKVPEDMDYVLDRIRYEGPMKSKDFERNIVSDEKGWAEWSAYKMALFHLFMEGKIVVSHREGFQKVYDLAERWLPTDLDTSLPDKEEYLRFLIRRDLKAHGLMKATEVGYLLKGMGKDINACLDQMVKEGEVRELKIRGRDRDTYFYQPSSLELLEVKGYRKRLRFLSPFDNLLINRKRTLELFDFEYILECYVPQSKRKFGYFGLPILWGDELIGQIDVKAERKEKVLGIRNLQFKETFRKHDHISELFRSTLNEFMRFNDCETIQCASQVNKFW